MTYPAFQYETGDLFCFNMKQMTKGFRWKITRSI